MINVLTLIFILIIAFMFLKNREPYSQAAITQLIAKGPQDTYLTGDAYKYIPPYGYYGYYPYLRYGGYHSGYPWNISTRIGRRSWYYPYYYNYRYYPWSYIWRRKILT
jgi:hypothetical protein